MAQFMKVNGNVGRNKDMVESEFLKNNIIKDISKME
jgi:hypothetical protein